MTSFSKKRALFLAAMLSATASAVPQASAANNLMELLFPGRRVQSQPVMPPEPRVNVDQNSAPASRAPIKRVTVTAPKNYDYKADALVQIDLTKIDPQLTASAHVGTGVAPSMEMDQFGLKIDHLREAHVKAEKDIADAIVAYYASGKNPIWTVSYDVSPKAKAVIALFAKAAESGLDPQDYVVKVPGDDYERSDIPARLKELAEFELSLSARALRYAMDQGDGRINPNRLSGFHDLNTDNVKPRTVIDQLASAGDASAVLAGFEPQNKWYTELKQNLHAIADTAGPSIHIAPGTLIRPGESNAELKNVVALIRAKAPKDYLLQHDAILQANETAETYDVSLVEAVKDYQKSQGRQADGVIGNATIKTLQGESSASKRDRILYFDQRLRWLPRDFSASRYVFIDPARVSARSISTTMLEKLAMNVVVGSATNQTYFFNDTIETVVFNPVPGGCLATRSFSMR